MSRFSDLDHLEINASVYRDRIEEIHQLSDIRLGRRKVAVTKVWRTERVLGRETFGQVYLQVQDQEPENRRALKSIPLRERMTKGQCERELTALIEFTKPKVRSPLADSRICSCRYSTKTRAYLSLSSDGFRAKETFTSPWSTFLSVTWRSTYENSKNPKAILNDTISAFYSRNKSRTSSAKSWKEFGSCTERGSLTGI